MKYLTGQQAEESLRWIREAINVAQNAPCHRDRCGAVIVRNGVIIGRGFNSPPGNDEVERRCDYRKDFYNRKVTDKTCCVHAEQRAIMDALKNNSQKIKGAQLYFARFPPNGERRLLSGLVKLYCTICTKMMFDVGIADFVLEHQDGVCSYLRSEYNKESFNYK